MCDSILDKVTIIIPTYERYDCLARLLKYYSRHDIRNILILDSSRAVLPADLKLSIESNSFDYRRFDADIIPIFKVQAGLAQVKTPFTCFCPDDDFLTSYGLTKALEFLMQNPDYSTVLGATVCFFYSSEKSDWVWEPCGETLSVESTHLNRRLVDHLTCYAKFPEGTGATFYGVAKTKEITEIINQSIKTTPYALTLEIVMTGLQVIQGKMKRLPIPYLYRDKTRNHRDLLREKNDNYSDRFRKHWSTEHELIRQGVFSNELKKIEVLFAAKTDRQSASLAINGYLQATHLDAAQMAWNKSGSQNNIPTPRKNLLLKLWNKSMNRSGMRGYLERKSERKNERQSHKLLHESFSNFFGKDYSLIDSEFEKIKILLSGSAQETI